MNDADSPADIFFGVEGQVSAGKRNRTATWSWCTVYRKLVGFVEDDPRQGGVLWKHGFYRKRKKRNGCIVARCWRPLRTGISGLNWHSGWSIMSGCIRPLNGANSTRREALVPR